MVQLTGSGRVFVQYCAGGGGASGTSSEVTISVELLLARERYLCVTCRWFRQYGPNDLRAVWECYIVRLEIG